jgi:hypothetical protein
MVGAYPSLHRLAAHSRGEGGRRSGAGGLVRLIADRHPDFSVEVVALRGKCGADGRRVRSPNPWSQDRRTQRQTNVLLGKYTYYLTK